MTANKGDEFGEPIIGGKCWEKGARNDFEKACAFPLFFRPIRFRLGPGF